MDFLGATTIFKRDHPHNYWVRILCFAFSIVFIALWITEDVEATDQDVFTGPRSDYPYLNYMYSSFQFVHLKEDLIGLAYNNIDGDLIFAYKRETSDTWNKTEVAAYNWDGLNGPWRAYGVVATSNGSVAICAGNIDGTTVDSVYLWVHFLGDDWDTWDDEELIDSSVGYIGAVAINDTDRIMFACRRGSGTPYPIFYQIFDFPNYTIEDFTSWQGKGWGGGATLSNYITLAVNLSGEFHHVVRGNDGIDYYIAHSDLWTDKHMIAGSSSYMVRSAGFLNNDMLVACGMWGDDTMEYWFQTEHEGAFTRRRLSTDSNEWQRGAVLSLLANSNGTRVLAYNTVDDHVFKWASTWNGSEASWQNSKVETDIYDSGYIRTVGHCNHRWPQDPDGRQWAMPTGGWTFVGWNDTGSTDTHEVMWNGTEFYGDLTTEPPVINTTALDAATYGVYYTFTLEGGNGTNPLNWSLLIGPSWMSLGLWNGTLYGMPDGTGTETVKVRLSDVIPRTDDEQWTLTIGSASEGEGAGGGIWGDMWLGGEHCSSAGVLLLIILFALGIMGIVGSWER